MGILITVITGTGTTRSLSDAQAMAQKILLEMRIEGLTDFSENSECSSIGSFLRPLLHVSLNGIEAPILQGPIHEKRWITWFSEHGCNQTKNLANNGRIACYTD